MYISHAYIFSCTLHRDCIPKYCAIFFALLRSCFFLLPKQTAMCALFAHCLFMYRNVRFLTEYDLIWIFFNEYFRYFSRVVAITTDYRIHVHPSSLHLVPPAVAIRILTSVITCELQWSLSILRFGRIAILSFFL